MVGIWPSGFLIYIPQKKDWFDFDFWCFNVTFNNISAIHVSWRPVLMVEESGENHRPWAIVKCDGKNDVKHIHGFHIFFFLWPRVAQWVRLLDLTTHTSLSPIRHGFAPDFVNYKKGCTRLVTAIDKVYQLLDVQRPRPLDHIHSLKKELQ
jgi:hypothetical protein